MSILRRKLLTAAVILGAGIVFLFEGLVVVVIGSAFGWHGGLVLSVLALLGVVTAIVYIRLKRKYTVEVSTLRPTKITLKEIRAFTILQWIGVVIAAGGLVLAIGNKTGTFPTLPFLGTVLIAIGVSLYAVAKS